MATDIPARVIGAKSGIGRLQPGSPADFQHLFLYGSDPATVWQGGNLVRKVETAC